MAIEKEDLAAVVREVIQAVLPQLVAETQKVQPAMLSVEQAATYLGVHHQTVRKLIREKELPHTHIATRIMLRKKSLDDYLERQERASVNVEDVAG